MISPKERLPPAAALKLLQQVSPDLTALLVHLFQRFNCNHALLFTWQAIRNGGRNIKDSGLGRCQETAGDAPFRPFWNLKFRETVKRDQRNLEALRQLGWRVAIVWECSIDEDGVEPVARKIASWLLSGRPFAEISKINLVKSARAKRKRLS